MSQTQTSFFSHFFQIKNLKEMSALRKELRQAKMYLNQEQLTHQKSQTIINNVYQKFEVNQSSDRLLINQHYWQITRLYQPFKKQILYCFLIYQLKMLCKIPIFLLIMRLFQQMLEDNQNLAWMYLGLTCAFLAVQSIINQRVQHRAQQLSIRMQKYYLTMLLRQIFNNNTRDKQQASKQVLNIVDKIDTFLKTKVQMILKGLAVPLAFIGLNIIMVHIVGWFWLVGTSLIILVKLFYHICLTCQSCADTAQMWKKKRQQLFQKAYDAYRQVFMMNWADLIIQKIHRLRANEISAYHRQYLLVALRSTLNYGLGSTLLLLVLGFTSRVSNLGFIVINLSIISCILFWYLAKDFQNAFQGLSQYKNLTQQIEKYNTKAQKRQSVFNLFTQQQQKNPEDKINAQEETNILIQLKQVSIYSEMMNNQPHKFIQEINLQINSGDILPIVIENQKQKDIFLKCLTVQGQNFDGTINIKGQESLAITDCLLIEGPMKDNILLGRELNQTQYQKVIRASSLQDFSEDIIIDIEQENGSLMKKLANRVSLARGLYSTKQLVVIDDAFEDIGTRTLQKVMSLISELNQQFKTTFVILLKSIEKSRNFEQVFVLQNKKLCKIKISNFKLSETSLVFLKKFNSERNLQNQSSDQLLLKAFGKGNIQKFKYKIEKSQFNFWNILLKYLFRDNNCKFLVIITLLCFLIAQLCLSFIFTHINQYFMFEKGQLPPLGNYTQFWAFLTLLAFFNTLFYFLRVVFLGYTLLKINTKAHNDIVAYTFSDSSHVEQVFQNKYKADCFLANLYRLDTQTFRFLNMFFTVFILTLVLFVYFAAYNYYLWIFGVVLAIPIYIWNRYSFATLQFSKQVNKKYFELIRSTFEHTINSLLQIRVNNYQNYLSVKINGVIQQFLHTQTLYTRYLRVYLSYTQYYCLIVVIGMFFGILATKNQVWMSQYVVLASFLLDNIIYMASSFGQSTELVYYLQGLNTLKQRILPNHQKTQHEIQVHRMQKNTYPNCKTSEVMIGQTIKQKQVIQKRPTQATEFMNRQPKMPTLIIKRGQKAALIAKDYYEILQFLLKTRQTQNFKFQILFKHSDTAQNVKQFDNYSLIDLNSQLLFKTVKDNIDPYNIHKQQRLKQIVKKVGFHNRDFHNSNQIDAFLQAKTQRLTLESRCLVNICRAVLQNKQIVVVVDLFGNKHRTNFMLFNKIAQLFKDKTILYLVQNEINADSLKVNSVYELNMSTHAQFQKLR